jgi:beta-glucosidase
MLTLKQNYMNMKKILLISVMSVSLCLAGNSQKANGPKLGKDPVSKVMAAMTLQEKASLVVGTGMRMMGMPSRRDSTNRNRQRNDNRGPVVGQTEVLVPGAAGTTYSLSRLGITPMVYTDGPAGVRISPTRPNDDNTYYCTAFPVGTLLASTWDVDLVKKVGQAMGNEVLEYGCDVLLGPGMNIQRNPLCGRNFEYYSEDPYITGKMGAAMVTGVESEGVGTSIKHFDANNAETNRNTLNTIVSERALREIYLEGFRIAVQEAQPRTVMSSYNLINGTYASENHDLLTNILRKDWGFRGYVMTDWFGGMDPVAQMEAGNDQLMPGNPNQVKAIVDAVNEGKLDEKVLDQNVKRILTGMLVSPRFKGYKYTNKPDLKAHAEVTRQAASEGMVLLKNTSSTLPFNREIRNIAVFGNTSYSIITGGTGSGDVNEAYSVSLIEGLENDGYKVNDDLNSLYDTYLKLTNEGRPRRRGFMAMMGSGPIDEMALNNDIINGMAENTDAALITIGRNSGEGRDRKNEKGDFRLTDQEQQLIKDVTTNFHAKNKKVVVILNIGGPVETASWKDLPDAILLAWQGGQETGNSIADILSGKVNPSGKLAVTFPVKYEDVPSAATFPGKEIEQDKSADQGPMAAFRRRVPAEVTYTDGIYVGYRYYETFNVKPSYEFGYGLSYTTFEYSNIKLSSTRFSKNITVTVDIKNTGGVAGKEVAELYLTAPARELDKPLIELKGFAKTKLLQPGESQTLTFTLDSRSLASFDTPSSTWVAEAGQYIVKIGASSEDIRQSATFTLAKDLKVKKVTASLVPKVAIDELKPPAR